MLFIKRINFTDRSYNCQTFSAKVETLTQELERFPVLDNCNIDVDDYEGIRFIFYSVLLDLFQKYCKQYYFIRFCIYA